MFILFTNLHKFFEILKYYSVSLIKKKSKVILRARFLIMTYIKLSKYMKLTNNIEQIQNSFKIGLACFHTSYIELKYLVFYYLHIPELSLVI